MQVCFSLELPGAPTFRATHFIFTYCLILLLISLFISPVTSMTLTTPQVSPFKVLLAPVDHLPCIKTYKSFVFLTVTSCNMQNRLWMAKSMHSLQCDTKQIMKVVQTCCSQGCMRGSIRVACGYIELPIWDSSTTEKLKMITSVQKFRTQTTTSNFQLLL